MKYEKRRKITNFRWTCLEYTIGEIHSLEKYLAGKFSSIFRY